MVPHFSIVWLYKDFFTQSPIDGHFSCLVFAIMQNAIMRLHILMNFCEYTQQGTFLVMAYLDPKLYWCLLKCIVVLSLSCVQLFVTPGTAACQASLSFTTSQSLLKLMSIESGMPSNHLILCCPLFLLPSTFPSIRVFSNELALHNWWSKHWSLSLSNSPSNEYSELISFGIDWFELLAVQRDS